MNAYEELVAWLREAGFHRSRSADKFGREVWARKGVTANVVVGCSAVAAEAVRVKAVQDMSVLKRKPKAARARESAEKKRAALEVRRHELERLIALRNRELDGVAEFTTPDEQRAIIRVIDGWQRELRQIQSYMRAPGPIHERAS